MGLTLKVIIAGVDRTNCVAALSAEWEDALDGFGPLRCVMRQSQVVYVPPVGASFKISDGASPETIYWDGQIFRVVRRWAPNSVDLVEFDVECQPYTHIFARRMVWKDRENKTLYNIVSWINTNLLAGEGISLSGVENPGPTITERLTWFLVPISRAFDDLAAITGRHWRLGPAKVLKFAQLTVEDAPFNITDTVGEWEPGSVEIEEDDAEYANRIHEVSEIAVAGTGGSTGTAGDTEEAITAFAGQLVYETKAIVQEMLDITVNGIAKTFIAVEEGESVPGSGYDFYYIRGGIGFFELDFGPAAGGEVIRFRYRPGWSMYPDSQGAGTDEQNAAMPGVRVVTVDNAAAQTARAAIDGGSGIYEMREEQRVVTDAATLKSIGEGRLRQYAVAIKKIRLTTHRDDALLRPGQRILVNLSEHSINQQVYIERCQYRWLVDAAGFTLHTTIHCTSNEPTGRHAGIMEHTIDAARIGLGGVASGSGNVGAKIVQERPGGTVDGTNTVFTLTYYPVPPLVWLKSGGRAMDPFSDYSLDGAQVTYVAGSQPKSGEEHWVWYQHNDVTRLSVTLGMARRRITGSASARVGWGGTIFGGYDGAWTIVFWIKPTNLTQASQLLFTDATISPKGLTIRWEEINDSLTLGFPFGTGGSPVTGSGIALPDTNWHHVAYRKQGANPSALYKFLDGSPTLINASITLIPVVGYLVTAYGAGAGSAFAGALHNLGIYKRALTDAEISSLASAGSVRPESKPNCELSWWMNGSDPETDKSGNGRNGTVYIPQDFDLISPPS